MSSFVLGRDRTKILFSPNIPHYLLRGRRMGKGRLEIGRGHFLISSSELEIDMQTKKFRELWAASYCFLLGSGEVPGRIFCLQPLVE